MGGCLALNMLLGILSDKILGIFTMGSFVTCTSRILNEINKAKSLKKPILMMHGSNDTLINYEWGENTATSLLLLGADVQFRKYEMVEHEIDTKELYDLVFWMKDIIDQKLEIKINEDHKDHIDNNNIQQPSLPPIQQQQRPLDLTERDDEIDFDENNNDKIDNIEMDSSNLILNQIEGSPIGYYLKKSNTNDNNHNSYIVIYEVAASTIPVMVSRPVLCCGASFDIVPTIDGRAIQSSIISTDPHGTAKEIAKRLIKRLTDDPNAVNPCPIS